MSPVARGETIRRLAAGDPGQRFGEPPLAGTVAPVVDTATGSRFGGGNDGSEHAFRDAFDAAGAPVEH